MTVGKTLLTVEHDMGVVFGLADKIAVVVYGEVIAFDTPEAVRANARVQEAYLGSSRRGRAERRTLRCCKLENLHAFYGKSHVLHGVHSTSARRDRRAAGPQRLGPLDHRQGLMGLVHAEGGLHWKEQDIAAPQGLRDRAPGHRLRAREPRHLPQAHGAPEPAAGPEGQGGRAAAGSSTTCTACSRACKERQHTEAGVLSGGEQQMLTLCRTLMGDPELIIIDEPTEGLAPKIVELVAEYLRTLKDKGISVLLIEQKLTIAMEISDRALVMGHGSIVFDGTPDSLRADAATRKEWLEV